MKKSKIWQAIFITPCLVTFILVILVPFFLGVWYSLTDWNGISTTQNFVGFANYIEMFQSPEFLYSFLVTIIYTVINVLLVNLMGFSLALLVTSKIKTRNLCRAGFFVPNLIGGVVLGYIWQFVFNQFFPDFFETLGTNFMEQSMLSNANLVVFAMSIVFNWQYAGYIMIIFVAAIQGVSGEVLEAAKVDGASKLKITFKILIPMIAHAFTISMFLIIKNSFMLFDMNLVLTGGGPSIRFMGSVIKSSSLLPLTIYNKSISSNQLAKGQAMSVVFFIVIALISLIQVTLNKRKEVEL